MVRRLVAERRPRVGRPRVGKRRRGWSWHRGRRWRRMWVWLRIAAAAVLAALAAAAAVAAAGLAALAAFVAVAAAPAAVAVAAMVAAAAAPNPPLTCYLNLPLLTFTSFPSSISSFLSFLYPAAGTGSDRLPERWPEPALASAQNEQWAQKNLSKTTMVSSGSTRSLREAEILTSRPLTRRMMRMRRGEPLAVSPPPTLMACITVIPSSMG